MGRNDTTFQVGNTFGKGRPKGSKNRTTEEIRNFIQQVVDNNLARLEEDLNQMSPKNRWDVLEKISKYFLPALSKNDNTNNTTGEVTIKVEYVDKDTPKELGNQGGDWLELPDYLNTQ